MGWIIAWGWLSIFVGLFAGSFISYGMGSDQ